MINEFRLSFLKRERKRSLSLTLFLSTFKFELPDLCPVELATSPISPTPRKQQIAFKFIVIKPFQWKTRIVGCNFGCLPFHPGYQGKWSPGLGAFVYCQFTTVIRTIFIGPLHLKSPA